MYANIKFTNVDWKVRDKIDPKSWTRGPGYEGSHSTMQTLQMIVCFGRRRIFQQALQAALMKRNLAVTKNCVNDTQLSYPLSINSILAETKKCGGAKRSSNLVSGSNRTCDVKFGTAPTRKKV